MSYKLLQPLALTNAKTSGLNLVPTDKNLKPVLVIRAPLTPDTAGIVGASWLFDVAGNPQHFKGTINLLIEISGAMVVFSMIDAGESFELKTQKVAHLNCIVSDEKEEDGGSLLQLSMRCHLPFVDVDDAPAMEGLIKTIRFVARLNKAKFDISVNPQQQVLGLTAAAQGDDGPLKGTREIPFKVPVGRKEGLVGLITLLAQVDPPGSFSAGWEMRGPGIANQPVGGEQIHKDSYLFASEEEALEWAAREMMRWLKDIDPAGAAEVKCVGLFCDWLLIQVPALKKETLNA